MTERFSSPLHSISWLIWYPCCANFELRLIKLRVQFATSWHFDILKSKMGIVQDCLPRREESRRRSAVQRIWRVLAKPSYFPQRSSLRAYDRRSFQPMYPGIPKKYPLTAEGARLRSELYWIRDIPKVKDKEYCHHTGASTSAYRWSGFIATKVGKRRTRSEQNLLHCLSEK